MSAPRVMADAREISDVVGANVKLLRRAHGWSVREFVAVCSAADWKVSAATIDNIEGVRRQRKGDSMPRLRREISVDELVRLGRIYKIAPVRLLKPLRVRIGTLVIEDDHAG